MKDKFLSLFLVVTGVVSFLIASGTILWGAEIKKGDCEKPQEYSDLAHCHFSRFSLKGKKIKRCFS